MSSQHLLHSSSAYSVICHLQTHAYCIVLTFASSRSFQLEYWLLAFHFPLCNNSRSPCLDLWHQQVVRTQAAQDSYFHHALTSDTTVSYYSMTAFTALVAFCLYSNSLLQTHAFICIVVTFASSKSFSIRISTTSWLSTSLCVITANMAYFHGNH